MRERMRNGATTNEQDGCREYLRRLFMWQIVETNERCYAWWWRIHQEVEAL